ncbi:hypothetical protein AVEN_239158-1 [Araneus ventricosus]|uniref:Integrase catalytic domain-containing protein n=1 Tax=Araneus ventricosus TaxID=182803 RepID=A0A4Y2HAR3_ARAVE|nr:hypothetical protein AVEN_239158-1 [Araneus ventricosus]
MSRLTTHHRQMFSFRCGVHQFQQARDKFLDVPVESDVFQRDLIFKKGGDVVSNTCATQVNLTYGTVSAPFLATRTLKVLADEERKDFPKAADVICSDIYMDDILSGEATIEDAKKLQAQICELFLRAGFELHKWVSNSPDLLQDLSTPSYSFDKGQDVGPVKTLGMLWDPKVDCLTYEVKIKDKNSFSKREVLSEIARLYDPLGLIGPIITKAKIFIQGLWKIKLDWSEQLPPDAIKEWKSFFLKLSEVNNLKIQRYIFLPGIVRIEIHGFSDALERAYAAVLYLMCFTESGQFKTSLLCSKSRVAPLKTLTIPRFINNTKAKECRSKVSKYLTAEELHRSTEFLARVAQLSEFKAEIDALKKVKDVAKTKTVTDLTTEAFIAALKKLCALRGRIATLMSDNVSNFKGAASELNRLKKLICQTNETLANYLCSEAIQWKFIPPRSPNFGGLWEAGVKSFKHHLHRTLTNCKITIEEFETIVIRIEGILNSRPLIPLSDNINEYEVLTPRHFIIGRPITAIPEPEILDFSDNRLSRWQYTTKCVQTIWKRWKTDYLNHLQQRNKWQLKKDSVRVGCLVLLKENDLPPCKWAMARILELIYGNDCKVRVIKLKTATGIFIRSISKICLLPIKDNYEN